MRVCPPLLQVTVAGVAGVVFDDLVRISVRYLPHGGDVVRVCAFIWMCVCALVVRMCLCARVVRMCVCAHVCENLQEK